MTTTHDVPIPEVVGHIEVSKEGAEIQFARPALRGRFGMRAAMRQLARGGHDLVTMADAIAYADARCAALRGAMHAVYAELQRVAPWSESNDMDWADKMMCGIGLLAQDLDALRADRDALAGKVRALQDDARRVFDLYPRHWDRVGGGLFVDESNVAELDSAFEALGVRLGLLIEIDEDDAAIDAAGGGAGGDVRAEV